MALELMWKMNRQWEEQARWKAEWDRKKNEENAAIMAKRPVLFVGKNELWGNRVGIEKDKIHEYEMCNIHPITLADEIRKNWHEPIGKNTIEDLVACCQYAIDNYTVEKGRLHTLGREIELLKSKVTDVEFWEGTYWFMRAVPAKIGENALKDNTLKEINHRLCEVLNNNERANKLKQAYSLAFISLSADAHSGIIDSSWELFLKEMSQVVQTNDWWYLMYCLLRIDLHPGYSCWIK